MYAGQTSYSWTLRRGLTPVVPREGECAVADVEESRVAAHGQRPAAHDLHAGVLLRVVRRGDHDPAVELEVTDREIDHLGTDKADVEHLATRAGRPVDDRLGHRRRRDSHVAADGDASGAELLDVGSADGVRAVLVQLVAVDPAHVVRLEDLRVEHGVMLAPRRART